MRGGGGQMKITSANMDNAFGPMLQMAVVPTMNGELAKLILGVPLEPTKPAICANVKTCIRVRTVANFA